jgi:hypothetical protein
MHESTESTEVAAPLRPTRLNLERAREMIAAWRESGLTRTAYAERRGICLKTFDRWRSRVEAAERMGSGLARVGLRAGVGDVNEAREALRVIPGSPPQVVLPADWDAACLQRVLEACRC